MKKSLLCLLFPLALMGIPAHAANLIFSENFEGSDPLNTNFDYNNGNGNCRAVSVVAPPSPVRGGSGHSLYYSPYQHDTTGNCNHTLPSITKFYISLYIYLSPNIDPCAGHQSPNPFAGHHMWRMTVVKEGQTLQFDTDVSGDCGTTGAVRMDLDSILRWSGTNTYYGSIPLQRGAWTRVEVLFNQGTGHSDGYLMAWYTDSSGVHNWRNNGGAPVTNGNFIDAGSPQYMKNFLVVSNYDGSGPSDYWYTDDIQIYDTCPATGASCSGGAPPSPEVPAPSAPTGLNGSASSANQINLNWADSDNEDGFRIERASFSSGPYSSIASTATNITSYSNTGLAAGTQYFYRVKAYNAVGDSNYSNVISVTTPTTSPGDRDPASTASVTRLILANNSNSGGAIRDLVNGATYYLSQLPSQNLNVEAKVSSNSGISRVDFKLDTFIHTERSAPYAACGDWAACPNMSGLTTTSLTTPGTHLLTVTPYDSAGLVGTPLSISFVVMTTPTTVAPAVPTNLVARLSGTITQQCAVGYVPVAALTWTDVATTETEYRVYRATTSTGTYQRISTLAANSTSYNDSAVSYSNTYYYKVATYNAGGESVTNPIPGQILPPSCPLPQPTTRLSCTNWRTAHPDWIFCDDFEDDALIPTNYYDYDRGANLSGVSTADFFGGTKALRLRYKQGNANAGYFWRSFGRNPVAQINDANATKNFQEIWYRFYVKMPTGWQGNPQKLTRATGFYNSNRSQFFIAHIWQSDTNVNSTAIDPVSCTVGTSPTCVGYNDFTHMQWLGARTGVTPIYAASQLGQWKCLEAHVKLNSLGAANGVQEYYIDNVLQASRSDLNFRGSYNGYGINAISLEGYWNNGSPYNQDRYIDNFVISNQRVGCGN